MARKNKQNYKEDDSMLTSQINFLAPYENPVSIVQQ
jgi:hypothetical protein